jgi:hypothetical protein
VSRDGDEIPPGRLTAVEPLQALCGVLWGDHLTAMARKGVDDLPIVRRAERFVQCFSRIRVKSSRWWVS